MKSYSFKKLFFCFTLGFMPFSILIGILSLFEITPINFNGNAYFGIMGFIGALFLAPFVGFIMGFVSFIYLNIGVFLFNRIIKKDFKDA